MIRYCCAAHGARGTRRGASRPHFVRSRKAASARARAMVLRCHRDGIGGALRRLSGHSLRPRDANRDDHASWALRPASCRSPPVRRRATLPVGGQAARERPAARRDRVQPGAFPGVGRGRHAGHSKLARSGAKHRRLPKLTTITSLVYRLQPQHVEHGFNAAKGGDPMSHGSAERSVQFAWKVMA